jgi:hypothetical protein
MLNGVWTGVFQSKVKNVYQRSVVFVLADGKIYGGNSLAFFKGSYSVDGDQINGSFTGTHYYGETFTVFGLIQPSASFSLEFTAEIRNNELHGDAKRIDDPEQGVDFVFVKREDL